MDEKEYVNRIFDQYVQTQELLDLKEEVSLNLHESINDYKKDGFTKEVAFSKAIEDLGELEPLLTEFKKKSTNVWKWLYYFACGSVVIGLIFAGITFLEQIGWKGGFLALGCLYPFCIVQFSYILWYRASKLQRTVWNNIAGIATAVFLFFLINVLEMILREKYYYDEITLGIENSAIEIGILAIATVITIYAWRRKVSAR